MSAPGVEQQQTVPEFEDVRYEMSCEFCSLHVGWERPGAVTEEHHVQELWEFARLHADNPNSWHRGEPVVITRTSTITTGGGDR